MAYTVEEPVLPPPQICKTCGRKNRRYATRDNGKGRRYYNLVCCACRGNERRRQLRAIQALMDPIPIYRSKRDEQLRVKYGITLSDYEALFAAQGYGCAICGKDDRTKDYFLSMPVDHDHKTGKNRAILCNACNHMLGHAVDNPTILRKAADYLEAHQ